MIYDDPDQVIFNAHYLLVRITDKLFVSSFIIGGGKATSKLQQLMTTMIHTIILYHMISSGMIHAALFSHKINKTLIFCADVRGTLTPKQ